jgi:hypothetical protein
MADIAQSRDAFVVHIENMERLWNDAILRRDVDSAAIFQASEFRLVIGVEGQSLQVCLASWFGPLRHFVLAHPWDVEGLGIIHPLSRGGGGNVGIALSDFQGLWERWENSFIVFPCFP